MSKFYKISLGVFIFLIAFLTYLEAIEPTPINWYPSYAKQDKIPLGTYVFYENWKASNPDNFKEINIPPFEYLSDSTGIENGTYFFLNNYVSFDEDELNKLLNWVEKGNTAFIASDVFGEHFLDTLNLDTKPYNKKIEDEISFIPKTELDLVNPNFSEDGPFEVPHEFSSIYFSKIDTLKTTILGTVKYDDDTITEPQINFIETEFGEGKIVLHSTPEAFGNYFILKNNNFKYAENVLAYIDRNQPIYWDNYYKTGKAQPTSLLYIIMQNKPLKWAYYLMIIASLLFIIFEGKRKQRAIPVVKPLKNQSYEYTQTIADLYLEKKQVDELTKKRIQHFKEYIRTEMKLDPDKKGDEFYPILADKTGNSIDFIKELFENIEAVERKKATAQDYETISKGIHKFKYANARKTKNIV
ncbi:DUF4350 domain-containing protein [Zunongwangia sp. HRR-M8]|uniref:DUF4350 domain-containing protein n=1 Tax=Zunongwangia sp. HRR-M8 TaxID=3015170 RepID=UPI0022DE05EA|nr:DUF4350 domain-containing protein [Zunongwangia sp. HRR-M8]WBL21033.1 DUF4350 domain-containing protein [Zunongwangia sp. HRR-M8]